MNDLKKLEGHTESVTCLCFNQAGVNLASGSSDNNILVWNVVEGKLLHKLSGHV